MIHDGPRTRRTFARRRRDPPRYAGACRIPLCLKRAIGGKRRAIPRAPRRRTAPRTTTFAGRGRGSSWSASCTRSSTFRGIRTPAEIRTPTESFTCVSKTRLARSSGSRWSASLVFRSGAEVAFDAGSSMRTAPGTCRSRGVAATRAHEISTFDTSEKYPETRSGAGTVWTNSDTNTEYYCSRPRRITQ